jgi:hypothetical protein
MTCLLVYGMYKAMSFLRDRMEFFSFIFPESNSENWTAQVAMSR